MAHCNNNKRYNFVTSRRGKFCTPRNNLCELVLCCVLTLFVMCLRTVCVILSYYNRITFRESNRNKYWPDYFTVCIESGDLLTGGQSSFSSKRAHGFCFRLRPSSWDIINSSSRPAGIIGPGSPSNCWCVLIAPLLVVEMRIVLLQLVKWWQQSAAANSWCW